MEDRVIDNVLESFLEKSKLCSPKSPDGSLRHNSGNRISNRRSGSILRSMLGISLGIHRVVPSLASSIQSINILSFSSCISAQRGLKTSSAHALWSGDNPASAWITRRWMAEVDDLSYNQRSASTSFSIRDSCAAQISEACTLLTSERFLTSSNEVSLGIVVIGGHLRVAARI